LWTQEDDQVFLKWVTNKRDRCYHTMARDLSARPHEILNLKIKDVLNFKAAGNTQYAEVLVNGKTWSRHIPLIQSIPYIKEWLSDHPSRNNRILSLSVLVRILWVGRLTLVDYIKVIETIKKSSFQSFIYITLSHLPFEQV
jgi:integrase